MKSFTQLKSMFKSLSLNSSSANDTLAGILINDQHRYLILKYFDNERTVTMTTIAGDTLDITAGIASGGTSATLSSSWGDISCEQLVVFSNSEQRTVKFTQGKTAITWSSALSSAASATTIATVGVQSYPLPANVSKVKNATITVGQLVYTPAPVQSVQEWTKLNALPYSAEIPAYFFIYDGVLNFWPIPSASGDVITLNCQIKVPNLTYSDYTTPGTFANNGMVVGSNAVTGNSTTWASSFPTGTDLTFANLYITADPPNGDGLPYQIQSFTSDTALVLTKPVVYSPNISGGTMTIGQYPLLTSDFHDTIVYGALRVYFNSIVKDVEKYNIYDALYKERLQLMELYLSNKQVNVDLSVTPVLTNPNLYTFAPPNQ